MSTLKAILVLVGFVAIVGAALWFMPAPAPQAPVHTGLSYTLTQSGERYHEEVTDTYSIRVLYPNIPNAEAQAAVDKVVEEVVGYFKGDIISLINEAEAARIRQEGRPYELGVEYKPYLSARTASFEFDIYLNTGGAHPNAFYRTLVLDKQGKEVALADLFVPEAPYLERLSSESYTRVLAELGERAGSEVTPDMEETVRIGTSPSPEALQFFYLTDDALHLLFPPYQVASYAAGSFDIAIPLTALADILNPEFVE